MKFLKHSLVAMALIIDLRAAEFPVFIHPLEQKVMSSIYKEQWKEVWTIFSKQFVAIKEIPTKGRISATNLVELISNHFISNNFFKLDQITFDQKSLDHLKPYNNSERALIVSQSLAFRLIVFIGFMANQESYAQPTEN